MSDMIFVPGGAFEMGSEKFYPEERPVYTASVSDFYIAAHTVTNAEFAEFVQSTGYVTVAERALDATEFPALSEAELAAGSLVFRATPGPVDLRDWRQWWAWAPGANWRHPFGPGSDLEGKEQHPVVQVSYEDALAFAEWSGARLPTEAEWERAARGGAAHEEYAWGSELHPGGQILANTWQGRFPYENAGALGHRGTAPVGSFAPNAYGLYDMIGNVWEWTSSEATPDHQGARTASELAARQATQPRGLELGLTSASGTSEGCGCGCGPSATNDPQVPASNRVTKGGSHLCSPDYCMRYRPAARSQQSEDSATTHIGFPLARSA